MRNHHLGQPRDHRRLPARPTGAADHGRTSMIPKEARVLVPSVFRQSLKDNRKRSSLTIT